MCELIDGDRKQLGDLEPATAECQRLEMEIFSYGSGNSGGELKTILAEPSLSSTKIPRKATSAVVERTGWTDIYGLYVSGQI
jgi:hypothetical protein